MTILDVFEERGNDAIKRMRAGISDASGSLAQSIDYTVKESKGVYSFEITMEGYYKFVNDGRKPGGRPPIKNIEAYITEKGIDVNKPVQSKAKQVKAALKGIAPVKARIATKSHSTLSGTLKNRRSIAFAIATKIGKYGYKGNKFFSNVVNPQWIESFYKDLEEAGLQDIEAQLDILIKA